MTNITQLHTWTLHFSADDEEWDALCGEADPEMVVEPESDSHLPGYSVCKRCLTAESQRIR